MHTFKQKYPEAVIDNFLLTFGNNSTANKGTMSLSTGITNLVPKCSRQSDRTLPDIKTFRLSFMNAKFQLTAKEKYAQLFALHITLMTQFGWTLSTNSKFTQDNTNEITIKRITLIEKSLTIYRFLHQEKISITEESNLKENVRKYLRLYKDVVEYVNDSNVSDSNERTRRNVGDISDEDEEERISSNRQDYSTNNDDRPLPFQSSNTRKEAHCEFPKFHYLLHVPRQICEYGSSQNQDGSSPESNHKYFCKAPGERTQGRQDTIERQASWNLAAKTILDRAFRNMDFSPTKGVSRNFNSINELRSSSENTDIKMNSCSSTFQLRLINNKCHCIWEKNQVKPKFGFDALVLKFIKTTIMVETDLIHGFTCLDWKGNILHAHPSYRSKDPWFDWIIVQWTTHCNTLYSCPAQLKLFFESTDANGKKTLMAVVRSTAVNNRNNKCTTKANNTWKTRGKSSITRFWELEKELQVIPVNAIMDVAYVYEDFSDENMSASTGLFIEIINPMEWGKEMDA